MSRLLGSLRLLFRVTRQEIVVRVGFREQRGGVRAPRLGDAQTHVERVGDAAVVRPYTSSLEPLESESEEPKEPRQMVPAPRKPTPETTCAATRAVS